MATAFDHEFERIIEIEGGYVDDRTDRGGRTRYGVTEAVARVHGYTGAMSALPLDRAKAIYKSQYWDIMRLDEIAADSTSVARELFDTGINCGIGTAGKFLQRALNALNRQAADYADLVVDGVVGPVCVAAFKKYMRQRTRGGEAVMLAALNALQGARYIDIAERDPTQEKYTFGWFLNRVAG